MKLKYKLLSFLLIFSIFSQNLIFSESKTPEPYAEDEFPGFLDDLRRAEVITLGAMPFVTFNATLGYSFGKFAFNNFDPSYFVNPFAQSSESSFSTDEQIGLILTSLGISLCIGITDLIVNSVKRNNAKKIKTNDKSPIKINPIENDENAIKIQQPIEIDENSEIVDDEIIINPDFKEDVIQEN